MNAIAPGIYTVGPVTSVLELMLVVRSLRTSCTSPLSAASCNSVLSMFCNQNICGGTKNES